MKDTAIMCGNPITGFRFFGPFTKDEAQAEFELLDKITPANESVWILPLIPSVTMKG